MTRHFAMTRHFRERDVVVYEKQKHGTHPGPRAHDVRPAPRGDTYDYLVDKYWLVVEVLEGGVLMLRTPGGKLHRVDAADPMLRRPTWREQFWLQLWDRQRLQALRRGPGCD